MPTGPGGPTGPCLPGGPSGPGFPGEPGLPLNPGLPRRPALPFGPERQSFSSFTQNWFRRRRSSSLMSSFTWDGVWTAILAVNYRVTLVSVLNLRFHTGQDLSKIMKTFLSITELKR